MIGKLFSSTSEVCLQEKGHKGIPRAISCSNTVLGYNAETSRGSIFPSVSAALSSGVGAGVKRLQREKQ